MPFLRCRSVAGRGGDSEQERLRRLLRDVRTEAGLRQADLARRLGKPQSYVSKYESGERNLDFLEVREACLAMNVRFVDFVRRFERTTISGGS